MIKLFSAATLAATATAAVLVLPAAPAQARSLTCDKAISMVNAAIDMSGGNLTTEIQQTLADRLFGLADLAVGEERDVILGYANALVDDNIPSLDPATDELNRVCA